MKNGLIISNCGIHKWYKDDKLHRKNGPAIYYENYEWWYFNGLEHRVGGPSYKYNNGNDFVEHFRINGKLSRIDGPAVIRVFKDLGINEKEYWYNGKQIICNSIEEFLRTIKLKIFW